MRALCGACGLDLDFSSSDPEVVGFCLRARPGIQGVVATSAEKALERPQLPEETDFLLFSHSTYRLQERLPRVERLDDCIQRSLAPLLDHVGNAEREEEELAKEVCALR